MVVFSMKLAAKSLILVIVAFVQICFSKEAFFNEVATELRCSGCDLTIKVLDQMLVGLNKSDAIEPQVDAALAIACVEEKFKISEYKPSTMVKVCKFMKEYHGGELKRELLYHYSQPRKPTYLELSQHICLEVMRLCAGVSHKSPIQEDGARLHMDDNHDFTVIHGANVKTPNPVPVSKKHEEL